MLIESGAVCATKPPAMAPFEDALAALDLDPEFAVMGFRAACAFVNAVLLGEMGFRCVPCNRQKIPPKNWQNIATSDPRQLVRWQKQFREPVGRPAGFRDGAWWFDKLFSPNYSVLTGRYADGGGVWILDIDSYPGRVRLAELERELGPLPTTWTVVSGREDGGEHRWFKPHPEGADLKTVAHALIASERGKIDQKGRGGHAVLPGSLHKSGRRYEWAPGLAPDEVELAALPPEWLAALDYADAREAKAPGRRGPRRKSGKIEHDGSSRFIGDGPGRGGFHNPINTRCCEFFSRFGVDADTAAFKEALRKAILDAPCDPARRADDVIRYASDRYLNAALESARDYINMVRE